MSPADARRRHEFLTLTPQERLQRFAQLQTAAWAMMSAAGKQRFLRRNLRKRATHDTGR